MIFVGIGEFVGGHEDRDTALIGYRCGKKDPVRAQEFTDELRDEVPERMTVIGPGLSEDGDLIITVTCPPGELDSTVERVGRIVARWRREKRIVL